MFELPLFPLPSVLFPGMPINLHIFEERYKLMINECIDQRIPFGVVLIQEGSEEGDPKVKPHLVGCTAKITQMQPLDGGRMNITAIGQDRFKIDSISYEKPYLTGSVELFPLKQNDTSDIEKQGSILHNWVDQYLQVLQRIGKIQYNIQQIPTQSIPLAYLSAVLLQQIPPNEKQEILSLGSEIKLLDHLNYLYSREVQILKSMIDPPQNIDHMPQVGPLTLGPFVIN